MFLDLQCVLNLGGADKPPKFMVFVNKCHNAELAVWELWKDLPASEVAADQVVWFYSGMSPQFCEDRIQKLKEGHLWGMVCTNAAGMVSTMFCPMHECPLTLNQGLNIIQWHYVSSLCTLMQQLGWAGWGHGTEAIGLYLVEPLYFEDANLKHRHSTANKENREKPSKHRKPTASDLDSSVADQIHMTDISKISTPAEPMEIGPNDSPVKTVITDPAAIPNFPQLNSQPSAEYEDEVMRLYINFKHCDVC